MTLNNHLEIFEEKMKQSLEKHIEKAKINLIWVDFHKQFMEASRNTLLEVVNNYSFGEKIKAYFCENSHIRYKVAKLYLTKIKF